MLGSIWYEYNQYLDQFDNRTNAWINLIWIQPMLRSILYKYNQCLDPFDMNTTNPGTNLIWTQPMLGSIWYEYNQWLDQFYMNKNTTNAWLNLIWIHVTTNAWINLIWIQPMLGSIWYERNQCLDQFDMNCSLFLEGFLLSYTVSNAVKPMKKTGEIGLFFFFIHILVSSDWNIVQKHILGCEYCICGGERGGWVSIFLP